MVQDGFKNFYQKSAPEFHPFIQIIKLTEKCFEITESVRNFKIFLDGHINLNAFGNSTFLD